MGRSDEERGGESPSGAETGWGRHPPAAPPSPADTRLRTPLDRPRDASAGQGSETAAESAGASAEPPRSAPSPALGPGEEEASAARRAGAQRTARGRGSTGEPVCGCVCAFTFPPLTRAVRPPAAARPCAVPCLLPTHLGLGP